MTSWLKSFWQTLGKVIRPLLWVLSKLEPYLWAGFFGLLFLSFFSQPIADLVKIILPIGLTYLILFLAGQNLWINRHRLRWIFKIYFGSGILTYVRAFLIAVTTIVLVTYVYAVSPPFLRWGWGQLFLGNSSNIVFQPIQSAYQASEKVNELTQPLPSPEVVSPSPSVAPSPVQSTPDISRNPAPKPIETPASEKPFRLPLPAIDYRYVFILPILGLFLSVLPFWAEFEERMFRQGVTAWGKIVVQSIKFGLLHITAGIPICIALTLAVPGFLFACRYKYAYHKAMKQQPDELKAQEIAIQASTADHAVYNALLITLGVGLFLLPKDWGF